MNDPVISVVLPVWNGERYLADAIESVLRQTFTAFELLVIDDGSTDRSRAIADSIARTDPRVIVIAREHGGIVRALNAGIEAARGRYIARLDTDDVCAPSRLEKQAAFLDAHPRCVAVGSGVDVIDESGQSIGGIAFPEQHQAIEAALLNGESSLAHPSVAMRADAVRAAGGYREDFFPSEDFDLWLRLMNAGALANIPEKLVRYRRHRDAVGVRERALQSMTGMRLLDMARKTRGMPPLRRSRYEQKWSSPAAAYHFECTRIALRAGKRLAAMRHAAAMLAAAPLSIRAYAAIAACALPRLALVQLYSALRLRF